jgi:hypothetical protein
LKQGNLKDTLQKSHSFIFDYLQKYFEKNLQKSLQKQNMWCKRGPKCLIRKKRSMAQFQATFALTLCKLVQLCTSIFALVCVGIKSPKRGRLKGN